MGGRTAVLALTGDVMTGRGVDQILPHPGDPRLREQYVDDARTYVMLAAAASSSIPAPVDVTWPWGGVLSALDESSPDVRIVNLETAVTTSNDFVPGKGIHYRMHPENLGCVKAVHPSVCVLSNNHVLDFGEAGLRETLESLAGAGLTSAGAGLDLREAERPALLDVGSGRVLVWGLGSETSGVPPSWAAAGNRPGVAWLPDLSRGTAERVAERVRREKRRGDVAVVSIHWGSNWGYEVRRAQVRFAHELVDGGVDLVHGHSSHHPRPVEVYHGKLVLYGCGDLVNDYEGIGGDEQFRGELRLVYLASVWQSTGELQKLEMVPFVARRMSLVSASGADAVWLGRTLDRISSRFGSRLAVDSGSHLVLRAKASR